MKKNNKEAKNTMRDEYDFSKGVRGKHYKGYRESHTVVINKEDGTPSIQYFKEEDGAVMLDPDLKIHFPNSDSVNKALRSLIQQRI
jgi:hypothetical protein